MYISIDATTNLQTSTSIECFNAVQEWIALVDVYMYISFQCNIDPRKSKWFPPECLVL